MDREPIRWEHRLRSRLTTIKLALELLRRKPELCGAPDSPAGKALEATERLTEDVAELMRTTGPRSGE